MNVTAERASKKAYFSDLEGGHILDFQFTPDELNFTEGGRFVDRVTIGYHKTDYIWLSGKPSKFNLKMWVDRTQESATPLNNSDPFENAKTQPASRFSKLGGIAVDNLERSALYSAGKKAIVKSGAKNGNEVASTVYSATPDFKQNADNEIKGVYFDLEALLYYVRPIGFKLSTADTQPDGKIKITDYSQSRFSPPPMCRFYYGNYWVEGYIEEVRYSLTAMNKMLVPRRLEADISFLRTNFGYLEEVQSGASADDYYANNKTLFQT